MSEKITSIIPNQRYIVIKRGNERVRATQNFKSYKKTIQLIKENGADVIEIMMSERFGFDDEDDPFLVKAIDRINKIACATGYKPNVKKIIWSSSEGDRYIQLKGEMRKYDV